MKFRLQQTSSDNYIHQFHIELPDNGSKQNRRLSVPLGITKPVLRKKLSNLIPWWTKVDSACATAHRNEFGSIKNFLLILGAYSGRVTRMSIRADPCKMWLYKLSYVPTFSIICRGSHTLNIGFLSHSSRVWYHVLLYLRNHVLQDLIPKVETMVEP